MTRKPSWPLFQSALAIRVVGDGDPAVYTPEELALLVRLGLQYGRGLLSAASRTTHREQAETFRRRAEIIWILRGLPDRLRTRPSGQTTKNVVRAKLADTGIRCSERTLARDYTALGSAAVLRQIAPFGPEEDGSSPVITLPAGDQQPSAKGVTEPRTFLCQPEPLALNAEIVRDT